MYRVDVTPVVGLPQFGGWSQVVSNNFSSSQFVCAFSVLGDHAGNAGRDFTEQFSQFKASTSEELNYFIDQILSAAAELDVHLNLSCGIFTTNKIILGTVGGSVFLKRGGRTGVLLTSDTQVKIVEGKRNEADVVVLLTKQATDFLNEIEQKFLSGFETDSVVTSIIPGLHGLDDSSLSSLAFVSGGRDFSEDEHVEDLVETKEEDNLLEDEENNINVDDSSEETTPNSQPEMVLSEDEISEENKESNPKLEPLLDIPPSLKLRGAGKKREINPFSLPTKKIENTNDELSILGEVSTASTSSIGTIFSKIVSGAGYLIKNAWLRVKTINWLSLKIKIIRFFSQLKVFLLKIINFFRAVFRRLTAKDIYLQATSSRNLLRIVLPIVFVVVVIASLVGFLIYKNKQQVDTANNVLQPLIEQIDSAKNQLETQPIVARESVAEVIVQLEQLDKDFADQKKAHQIVNDQLASAKELYDQISGQEEFGQLEIFYDLRLVGGEFLVSSLDASQDEVVFLDKDMKQLILLNLTNKQVKKIDLNGTEGLVDLELTDGTATILGKGIFTKDLKKEADLNQIIEEGDSNRSATLIEGFATYIYVLNPEKRNIYRYSQQDDGYSDPIGWVSGAAGFDYNQVSSWAIDGDVWVATRDGGLHKLASGREQDFKIVGLNEPFTHTIQVFTHEDLANIYILEPDAKRLVIINKEGEFLKEIKSDSLSSTTTLFVSEKLNKVFAVSGSIVYAIGI